MIELILFVGRLLLLALLYLFLVAAVRTGIGLVSSSQAEKTGSFILTVLEGPRGLKGIALPITGPVVIGRSPGADIVVGDDFVSGRHARVLVRDGNAVLEDLDSTNGTLVNGQRVASATALRPGDIIEVGTVRLGVDRT
ncbi:MAG: FHA domain-containing protein [Coriobacteriia bacterium]|nr:FHA domain-containing protein [Coriobacteriia bacterium]